MTACTNQPEKKAHRPKKKKKETVDFNQTVKLTKKNSTKLIATSEQEEVEKKHKTNEGS